MWEGYNFWCGCVRCTATGKIIAASVVDGEVDKLDELSKRVRCATAGCRGYNVPDGSSSAEIEEGVLPMYRCSVCDRSDGFAATMTTRSGSLRTVDDYWTQQHTKTTPSPTDDSAPYNAVIESLHYSYKSTKHCCAHPFSWYVQ